MKKMRHKPRVVEDSEQPGHVLYVYRHRMPRKEFLLLGSDFSTPRRKPSKAQRAANRRRRLAELPPLVPTPRPDERDPQWIGRKARVLAAGRCAWCGATKRLCNLAKGDMTGLFSCPP
jgi:hypothetical protein